MTGFPSKIQSKLKIPLDFSLPFSQTILQRTFNISVVKVFIWVIDSVFDAKNFFSRYVDRIANAKWEVKELGLEHNGYV